jgi:hypothetical protein
MFHEHHKLSKLKGNDAESRDRDYPEIDEIYRLKFRAGNSIRKLAEKRKPFIMARESSVYELEMAHNAFTRAIIDPPLCRIRVLIIVKHLR